MIALSPGRAVLEHARGVGLWLALVLVASGCAGAATPTPSPAPPSAAPSVGPSPSPAATPATSVDPFAMRCEPVEYPGASAKLSFVWWVGGGDTPSDKLFRDALACFRQRYAGKIEVEVEFVPGQHDYEQKIKTDFSASGKLPIVVAPKRLGDFARLLIEQGQLVDLTPYFERSPEWQQISIADSTKLNTIDGKLVAAPDTFQTPIGLFYNTELLGRAGVTKIPETWDEWWSALDALKKAGIPAVALHTQDTGWSAMLIYEALVARDPAGREFLNAKFPNDFNQPFIIEANKEIARVFQYTTPDAVGAKYEMAANNFLSGKAAIMPNGPWMIGQFRDPAQSSPGFGDKVASGLYPGGVAVDDTGLQLGDFAIGRGYSQAETDAAATFIEFMNSAEVVRQRVIRIGSIAPNLKLPPQDLANLDPLAAKLIQLIQDRGAPILPNYQGQWNSVIQNETIPQGLAQLALGQITPEQFAQMLTDAAREANP